MDDEVIISLFFSRNETALSELSKKYGRYFVNVAQKILCNREDADSCVNDAYLKTWDTIPPAKPNVLKAFVGKIVKCVAMSMLRANYAGKRGGGEMPLVLEELSECVSDNSSIEDESEKKQLIEEINKFLWSCSEYNRRAFVLRYWHCASLSEIAKRLGGSENKAAAALFRTREKLKQHLTKEGYII